MAGKTLGSTGGRLLKGRSVEILYGLHNGADRRASGLWLIEKGKVRYWPQHMGILEE